MGTLWQIITKAAILLAAYFAPVKEVFFVMLVFVGVDLVTGVWASNKKKIPRSSRRARKSIKKLGGYLTVVLLSFMIEQVLAAEWFIAHRFVAAFICTVELLSVLENIAVITEHPVFLKLIKLVRGKASSDDVVKEIINEKNDVFEPVRSPGPDAGMPGNENNEQHGHAPDRQRTDR